MIYGKLWCVVKPSVGIPLFLGAVAVGSFAVHYMLMTHTTWLPAYYQGKAPKTAAIESGGTAVAALPAPVAAAKP
jgi:light-harvesting protein B-800-850 alpha chain